MSDGLTNDQVQLAAWRAVLERLRNPHAADDVALASLRASCDRVDLENVVKFLCGVATAAMTQLTRGDRAAATRAVEKMVADLRRKIAAEETAWT
jgi:hypothetical protein